MEREEERTRIKDAMDRLLQGAPIRSSGSLTIVNLAMEAGVKRVALTHRHKDLQQEFRDRIKASYLVPPKEAELQLQVSELKEALKQKERDLEGLRTEGILWSRLVRALELDNESLRRAAGRPLLKGMPRMDDQ